VPTSIIANHGANFFRSLVDMHQEIFDASVLEFSMRRERHIELMDVRLMVFAVMKHHRLYVNCGFQCVIVVTQFGELISQCVQPFYTDINCDKRDLK
jgi:hypothetical protein